MGQSHAVITRQSKGLNLVSGYFTGLPFLPLPQDFNSYKATQCSITHTVNGKTSKVMLPSVDKLMTEYCNEVLKAHFTILFIDFADRNFASQKLASDTNKVEYSVNLYMKICNLPIVMLPDPFRTTISFYSDVALFTPYISTQSANIEKLKNSIQQIEKSYLEKLAQVTYILNNKPLKLPLENAKWFIDFFNSEMDSDLSAYLVNAKARAFNPLPDDVMADERFRASMNDADWNEYDDTIKNEVAFYNKKFSGSPGYVPLDWRKIKAMLWTELLAGPKGNPTQWKNYPLQIGRFAADAGAGVIKNGRENSDLITTPEMRKEVQADIKGKNNIRAGIAYLYARAIDKRVSTREVIDDPAILTANFIKADKGLAGTAKRLGTTVDNILSNSGLARNAILKDNQPLKYQKAHIERYISGWMDWDTAIKNYNGGGDPKYLEKFNRALQIITSRTPE